MRAIALALLAAPLLLAAPARAACPDTAVIARLARSILDRQPAESLGPGMSLADGECARERMVALLAQPYGDPVGYKVGLTNDAAQRRFGVPHPLRGTIFHGTLRERSGAELPARFGAVPVIESDLLVRVRDEGIATAGNDPVAILRHLDQVIPFIELPDLVFAPGQLLDAGNLLAINVGARLGVVGTPIAAEATPEFAARLGSMTVILATDERELSRAPGTALLGHPLNVIPWLVQDLAKEGRRLRAGDYVSLGGFSPALPTEAGRTYTVRYEGLAAEPVSVTVRLR
jgi:2-keto-4-pentenoate hydratase